MTMFEKTTETKVEVELNVYAIPRTEHEISTSDDGCPFQYKVYAGYSSPYQDGAIKLHTTETVVTVPGGIPLLEKAIETLKEAIEEELRESQKKVANMQARIDALALIEYIPEASNG